MTAPNYPKCSKCPRKGVCVEHKVYEVTYKDIPFVDRFFYAGNLRGARAYWRKCHKNVPPKAIKITYTGFGYRPCETSQHFYIPTGD